MPAPLARGDVLVKRVSARLVIEAARSTGPLRALEDATVDALAGASDELGDELLLIRKLEFAFLAVTDGSPLGIALREAIRSAVRREIGRAQLRGRGGAGDVVLYRNEAEAVGAYLVALREGTHLEWPHRLFTSWGEDWPAVIDRALERGRQFAGEVLAEALSRLGWSGFCSALSRATAREVVSAWASPDRAFETLDPSLLPPDLQERLRDESTDVPEEIRRAACLARLFAEWPPARAMVVDLEAARKRRRAPASRLACKGGGLAYWLVPMRELGIDPALLERFPEGRVRRAVRWGLGQALQVGGIDPRDPALLLFAGEDPASRPAAPRMSLAGAEADGLQELALSIARRTGVLSGHLRLVDVGETTVVLDGTVVVHTMQGAATETIGGAVLAYRTFVGEEPRSVATERATSSDIDVVRDVDVPALPEPWRYGVRVMASVLRVAAAQRGIDARDTYDWVGSIVDGVCFELARRDVEGIENGDWSSAFPFEIEQRVLLLRVVG